MSTTTPRTVFCRRCGGTGTCPACDGTGLNPAQHHPGAATPLGICRSCKGDKHCIECGGKGRYKPWRAERPLRTSADPGFVICVGCKGSRYCQYCDGTAITDDGACNVCEYGTCDVCLGAGQVRPEDLEVKHVPLMLTFEQGHETAPDSPWGFQVLKVSTDGTLKYEHRARGVTRSRRGRVDPARVQSVIDALDTTTFPKPPQTTFVPGASILAITLQPPFYRVVIDYFDGLEMKGYCDVIRDLSALNTALRTDDREVLDQWHFQEDPASP